MPTNAPTELRNQRFRFPDYVDNIILAGAAKTVTPPAWARWAVIKVTDRVWIDKDETAIVPTADTDGAGANPDPGHGAFPVEPAEMVEYPLDGTISFSVIGTAILTVMWYGDESTR